MALADIRRNGRPLVALGTSPTKFGLVVDVFARDAGATTVRSNLLIQKERFFGGSGRAQDLGRCGSLMRIQRAARSLREKSKAHD